jgi:hypothetical protein
MKVEGKLLIRTDGVRLLLSSYRQPLVDGKGSAKRLQAQVQALSKETGLAFGTVRTLRDGSAEALLGAEHDCYPAGELVHEAVGAPERLFFAEEIGPTTFVVIAVDDRRVVLDELALSEGDLLSHFEVATSQFGDRPYTLAVAQSILDGLPSRGLASPQVLEVSTIETAVALSSLKFRAVHQIGSSSMSGGAKKKLAVAAALAVVGFGGYLWWDSAKEAELAEEMAMLAAMKNRAIDPLSDYKRSMTGMSADVFIDEMGTLIDLASAGRGWIPSRLDYENGQLLQISFSSFGGTRTQLVKEVRIRDGVYAQGPKGTQMLIDISQHPGRNTVPELQPLSKVLFETLDALDANSMGVLKVQVGEIASFGRWSSQKVQINVENAPLPLIKLLSKALKNRPVNVTQTELSLENQALSGVIHLDVFGS